MCGFVGYIHNKKTVVTTEELDRLEEQNAIIAHRGPDDTGFYTDDVIRFGFRRLSIIDPLCGKQPLSYKNDRYWIVFNGEIYNYIELRRQLVKDGFPFQTASDTEVILASYQQKKEKMLKDLRGMFAFVIWDKMDKTLFAARDPFGIKPFFYKEEKEGLFFASEKKSLLLDQDTDPIDQEALQHYLTFQFVPEPLTLSKNIKRLEPGHYIVKRWNKPLEIKAYDKPSFQPSTRPTSEKIANIRRILEDSVKFHMRSDVPVGAFLSSGIDSTSIVALARSFYPDIKTFTVGFDHENYSEIGWAKDTAEKLGVQHLHKVITPAEFIDALPKIVWHMDDPVADPAAIPLYFVAKEASKHVKVVLSGEGADELFGGYNIYREPISLRWFSFLSKGSKEFMKKWAERLPDQLRGKSFLLRGCTPIEDRYIGNAKIYSEEEKRKIFQGYDKNIDFTQVTRPLYEKIHHYNDIEKMQYIDLYTWLCGDILVKADRMTMAHSLELRVPFLDKKVFHAARELKALEKVTNGTTKYALRKAMEGLVPDSILYRKKLGFPVPIRHWLKDELYPWAQELIKESRTDAYLNKAEILKQLEWHRKGKGDYSRKIWTALIFMLWHQIYVEGVYAFQEKSSSLNDSER